MNAPSRNARAGLLTKRTLVIASHAVEQAAVTGDGTEPLIAIAMFQRLPYFERESEVYRRIAALAEVTVVGMVAGQRPDLPAGITPVLLHQDEELAAEWSVVVLSPRFGASVVATDLGEMDLNGTSLESARLFHGRWGFRREEAYAEAVRLRDALGDRLPPDVRRRLNAVLTNVVEAPATEVERRAEAMLLHLTSGMARARDRVERLTQRHADERADARDPWTGLHTSQSLESWLGTDRADTVELGLVLVRIPDLDEVESVHGSSAAVHTENNIADVLRRDLRPVDRAVRLSRKEFLLVLPAVPAQQVLAVADSVRTALASLDETYPHITVRAEVKIGSTTRRPLPLDEVFGTRPSTGDEEYVLSGNFDDDEWHGFLVS
ncbi:sensor domain-containing diguanylate cyclase [Lentzea flaviverrucosa]|uniref:GGDEF domain-containing protein, diguanylate cyclase (C-di-GMP synthetase) or its enzymatically inactive variants n=1 Tax=Lentzea flaviverrucosa TaxID=200379 RepID=A0A1H9WVE0_9PSEU|nr:DICT sensory domain-containing protein [Lentzea flaviverrucosa]RDI23134.1 GGDEF domain-containing protein [Lentzea flaviverrucosa]SES37794.1 GGDEF domain-containing protein, diguanylate cyclase (c-di-GMP synthetase) or its enzymatically inactive variants [Lentzea flaviverrucosa]